MKNFNHRSLLSTAILVCLGINASAQDTWSLIASFMGTARQGAVSFTVDGINSAFVGTGNDGAFRNDFWRYDQATDSWSQVADLPGVGRMYAAAFSIGFNGFVGTGKTGNGSSPSTYASDFYMFEPFSNNWFSVPDYPIPCAYAIGLGTRANADNRGFVGLGIDAGLNTQNAFYQLTGSSPVDFAWTPRAPFGGTGRAYATSFNVGNAGYVGFGIDNTNTVHNDLWYYDIYTDTWTQKTSCPGSIRFAASAFAIGPVGYITGGTDNATALNDLWAYNAITDTWTTRSAPGPSGRFGAVAYKILGTGYLATGASAFGAGNNLTDARAYTSVDFLDCAGTTNGSALPGASCEDGDPCTIGELLDVSCACYGGTALPDSDDDGLCDAEDPCPFVANPNGGSTFSGPFDVNIPWSDPLVTGCFGDVYNPTSTPGAPNATGGYDRFYRFTTSSCATHIDGQLQSFLNELPPVSIYLLDASGTQLNNWGSTPANFTLPIGPAPVAASSTYYLVIESPEDLDLLGLGISISQTNTDPDSDGDGICDNTDNCPFASGQIGSPCTDFNDCTTGDVLDGNCNCTGVFQDSDGDGICNIQDNCPSTGNSQQEDTDGDGMGDVCDSCASVAGAIGTACNDGQPCTANDMLNANCDCEGTPVPDSDGDSLCDTEDPCPLQAGPCESDGDGIPDANDNCPAVANADQADADGDGKGDACDLCPTVSNPGIMGCPATIYQVKTGSVVVGSYVRISNTLVTGVGSDGFFTQVVASDAGYTGPYFSGLFVHTGPGALLASTTVGARVHVDGTIALQQGRIQLDDVMAVTLVPPGPEAPPAPEPVAYADVITGAPFSDDLEGVIISLGFATIGAVNTSDGELLLTDVLSNDLITDDYLYLLSPTPLVGQTYTSVRGILTTVTSTSKLLPRSIADYTAGCSSASECNDSDPCTIDACVNGTCTFTPAADSDGDGLCDAIDNCPSLPGQIGSDCQAGPCNAPGVIDVNCSCATVSGAGSGNWSSQVAYPTSLMEGFSFSIGNKAYMGGGYNPLVATDHLQFWEFDPITDTWSQKADIPSYRYGASGFSIGTKGYMLGGSNMATWLNELWAFDPTSNTWIQKATYPGSNPNYLTTVTAGNKAYTYGLHATNPTQECWVYEPTTDSWTTIPDFPGGLRTGMSGFSVGNKIYLGFGGDGPTRFNDLWEFNTTSLAWSARASLPASSRANAIGFAIGTRGYVGTGVSWNGSSQYLADLWQYTPATDSWMAKTTLPGAGRAQAAAFSIGSKGYIGLGYSGENAGVLSIYTDLWEFDPGVSCVPCTPCDDGSSCTTNDAFDTNCQCVGTPVPDGTSCGTNAQCQAGMCVSTCTENVTFELRTDALSAQASWQILEQNSNAVLCNFTVPVNGIVSPITEECCLPAGCYRLRVLDSGGDGFVSGGITGGYQLRESGSAGRRIIDNMPLDGNLNPVGNFTSGSLSAIANTFENGAFCVPIGTVKPIFSSCDKLDWVNNQFIVAEANAAVSGVYTPTPINSVANTTSGYDFWFYDPNGTYSYRRFRSHATSDGFGTGATRACHFKINGWINNLANPHIPQNVLMNVRIRGRVNGENQPFGPACLFKLNAAQAACPIVKLQDNPANTADFSCGVSRTFGGANSASNRIVANPPQFQPAVVSSSVRYQFRFRLPGEIPAPGSCIVRPPQTSPTLHMNWSATSGLQLKCNTNYEVDVRVSKDGGATWCIDGASPACSGPGYTPWGKICTVNITTSTFCPPPFQGGGNSMAVETNGTLTMYPNPNRGDQLFINLSTVETEVNTVSVDIFDLSGKKVTTRAIPVQDGTINTALDLNGSLAGGIYLVNITAGTKVYNERLVIQP
ncbi:MAG: thrombospondin type 3 repeat-containing protein [Flavobacteriales bacterium]|nr:thrombospondin type 3 repeat-containing protein [Flavobacteriales bacterium]